MDNGTFGLIGQAMLAAGALGLAGAVVSVVRQKMQLARLKKANGKIVEVVARSLTPGNPYYHPVIEFRAADDRVIRFESPHGSYPQKPKIGAVEPVLYDPATPESAVINTFSALWFPAIVMGGLAVLAGLVGAMFIALSSG